jgi:hypothetical protein
MSVVAMKGTVVGVPSVASGSSTKGMRAGLGVHDLLFPPLEGEAEERLINSRALEK